jgi:hypothetical protein
MKRARWASFRKCPPGLSAGNADDDDFAEGCAVDLERVTAGRPKKGGRGEESEAGIRWQSLISPRIPAEFPQMVTVALRKAHLSAPTDAGATDEDRPVV